MRKLFKKISVLSVAAVLAAGTLSLAACNQSVSVAPDMSATQESVTSNGGFVVTTGDYYYFINGVETYTADNTFGNVVKGALMREKKSELKEKKNEAEIVVPSLITSSDYSSGIYIYGTGENARVYYATPNNVKNTSGQVENDYLDFKSAKLDGTDTAHYFRVSDNATVFRFVEVEGTVYVLYVENSNLHSYNTATKTDTLLVSSMSAYVLNSNDKTDPYVYYTMPVKGWIDTENGGVDYKFNQIYRVRADAAEAAHDFKLDKDWIENENDGKEPYHNFGSIVLDGIGRTDEEFDTRFSPDYNDTLANTDVLPLIGYNYTLQAYANGGIYFTRSAGSQSEGLYYLATDKLTSDWNSIRGNGVYTPVTNEGGALEAVANSTNASNAGTAALFYIDEADGAKHHYLYVKDSSIYRADVVNDGKGTNKKYGSKNGDLEIAHDESGATLVFRDAVSDDAYDYVYYTKSNSVNRVAYNGEASNYSNLVFGEDDTVNDNFKTVALKGVQHASSWYNYEIIDNVLFFANTETVGPTSYNYVYTVDLKNANGKLMNAVELEERNDNYDLVMGDEGYLATVTKDYSKLENAIKYYFYTGESTQFWTNIEEATAAGKKEDFVYKEDEKAIFKAFSEGKDNDFVAGLNGEGVKYRVQSAFITFIGQKSEADQKSFAEYWETALEHFTPAEEEGGLAWWAWMLIGIAIAVVVAGAVGLTVFLVLRKKKQEKKAPKERLAVDTSDDKDIDVYAVNDRASAEAEEDSELAVETVEQEDVAVEEAPVESDENAAAESEAAPAVEEAPEAPEAPAEEAPEAPAEDKPE